MLVGAPLFTAQLGAHKIRKLLSTGGDIGTLDLTAVGSAAQFIKSLGKMSPLNVLRLIDKTNEKALTAALLQHADDIDYVQSLLNVIGTETGVNPAMNAVADAFSRRRFSQRFKTGDQNVKLDALLNSECRVPADDDEAVGQKSRRSPQSQPNTNYAKPCFLFQSGTCSFQPCKFRHVCLICHSPSHGSNTCDRRSSQTVVPNKPPHPRFRRDRAKTDRRQTD